MPMTTTTYQVSGMTCGHCMQSVTQEVKKIEGVADVDVDLASGTVRITSETPVDEAAFRAAVDEAGDYEVVS
ncbi:MAG TPA: cation transporter [Acidimicrobiales bacterium]|nr:cation transporter [Acidimicrobiales bacterium]